MTTQREFLHKLVAMFDEVGIAYMIAGSLGSSFYGRPRATQDVDIVIAPSEDRFARLIALFEQQGYYVNRNAARDALRQRGMFNIIDIAA
jgi:hypothetical protein